MKTAKQIGIMIALFCTLFFIQCSSDENKDIEQKPVENYSEEINVLRKFLSISLPCELKKIVYDSERHVFVVERDILFDLEDVRERYNQSN